MRSRPVYAPPGLANSQAISCPLRSSFAHLEFLAVFCSSQKWSGSSVKLRRLVCPSRLVHVFISVNRVPYFLAMVGSRIAYHDSGGIRMSDNLHDGGGPAVVE